MKLGLVRYCKKEEAPGTKGVAKRLPKKLVEWCTETFHPYTFQEMTLLGVAGYEIILFLRHDEEKEESVKHQRILEELLRDFCDKDVEIVIPPEQGVFPTNIIRIAEGKAVKGLFALEAVKKVMKRQGKALKDCHIVIVDGGNFLTKMTLDVVYPNVNFLAVYTDRAEDFAEKAEEIYEDCGLNLQIFSSPKNEIMKEADAVLNCGCEMGNFDYAMKKGAFYFDIAGNRRKLRRLLVRRDDLFLADGLVLKKDGKFYSAAQVEGAAYITSTEFRRFLCARYDQGEAEKAANFLKDEEFSISGFTCLEKRVRTVENVENKGNI